MNALRKVGRALRKPFTVVWACLVRLAQFVAHEEPARVSGLLSGAVLALCARFGVDTSIATAVAAGVVPWLLAELARAQVTPAKGTVRLADVPDLDPADVTAQALAAQTPPA